jgi:hypothetical protein
VSSVPNHWQDLGDDELEDLMAHAQVLRERLPSRSKSRKPTPG